MTTAISAAPACLLPATETASGQHFFFVPGCAVVDAELAGNTAQLDLDVAVNTETTGPVTGAADPVAVRMGTLAEIHGAAAVAEVFKGRAQAAKPALVDGTMGVAVIFGGRLRIVLAITIEGDKISEINAIADPDGIKAFEVVPLAT